MDTPRDNDPTEQPGADPAGQPTEPQPPAPPPRRLHRTADDQVIAGVCGGLARYLGVDTTVVRVIMVVLALLGGAGVLAYVAGLLLIPADPATSAAAGGSGDRSLRVVGLVVLLLLAGPLILGIGFLAAGLLFPLAFLVLAGLAVWWLVSGEGPGGSGADVARRAALGIGVLVLCGIVAAGGGLAAGLGGGGIAAVLVIAAGVVLIAGAFAGGLRWLIPPALSLAVAVGFVWAAGIDLDGGVGEREYRPASASELDDGYRLGMGELTVDLRDAQLPSGDTPLRLDIGIGQARLIVPEDVCVATTADVGIGAVSVFDRDNGGIDLNWADQPRAASGTKRLVVDAEVGLGAFEVAHDDFREDRRGPPFGPFGRDRDDDDGDDGSVGNLACQDTRAAR